MLYDEAGNVIPEGLSGLNGDDPTIGTSAAEIIGAVNWEFTPWGFLPTGPGVMVREKQTLSPYIIAAGRNNQPQVTIGDALTEGVTDAAVAAQNISDNAQKLGEALFTGGKWIVAGIIGIAVMEAITAGRQALPKRRWK